MKNLSINFVPLPADLASMVELFRKHIQIGEEYIASYESLKIHGARDEAICHCMRHALDLAKGCILAAENGLPDALTTLSRALLETFFWARFVVLSNENAQTLLDSEIYELRRQARRNFEAGAARGGAPAGEAGDPLDGLEKDLLKNIPRRLSIEKIAETVGMEKLYAVAYSFMSNVAHGKSSTYTKGADPNAQLYADFCLTAGIFQCIQVIFSDWIFHTALTPKELLSQIIGITVG